MEATFNWVYFYDEISPFVDEAILAHLYLLNHYNKKIDKDKNNLSAHFPSRKVFFLF